MSRYSTAKYRTKHSINDSEVKFVLDRIRNEPGVFVDYGCHLGHLAIQVALDFPQVLVVAVDNFTGTKGDAPMSDTVGKIASGKHTFLPQFIDNIIEAEVEGGLQR